MGSDIVTLLAVAAAAAYCWAYIVAWHAVRENKPKWSAWWVAIYCLVGGGALLRDAVFRVIGWGAPKAAKGAPKVARGAPKVAKGAVRNSRALGRDASRTARAWRKNGRGGKGTPAAPVTPPPVSAVTRPRRRRNAPPLLTGVPIPDEAVDPKAPGAGMALTSAQYAHVNEVATHQSMNFGTTVLFLRQGIQHEVALAEAYRLLAEHLMIEVGLHPAVIASLLEYGNEHALLAPRLGGVMSRLVSIYGGTVEEAESGRLVVPNNARSWLRRDPIN